MPAQGKVDTLHRLIALLKVIPVGKPGKETGELLKALNAGGYSVHARSLQRDLTLLSQQLPIGCDDRSRPYRWYWKGNDAIGVGALSTPEALALVLVEQYLAQALPAQMTASFQSLFKRAHARLKSLGPNSRDPVWLKKVRSISAILPVIRPAIDAEIQATVGEALMNERQLSVAYKSAASDGPKKLTLNPLALILRGELPYLAATAKGHQDVRLYALHRIKSAQELMKQIVKPAGFDIDREIENGLGQFDVENGRAAQVRLVLRCNGWLARQLVESPLASDQIIRHESEGWSVVRATVTKSWQLNWWVLARIDSAEVIAPYAYRNEIGELLKRGASRYEKEGLRKAA